MLHMDNINLLGQSESILPYKVIVPRGIRLKYVLDWCHAQCGETAVVHLNHQKKWVIDPSRNWAFLNEGPSLICVFKKELDAIMFKLTWH